MKKISMKKISIQFLGVLMLTALSLTACGKSAKSPDKVSSNTATTAQSKTEVADADTAGGKVIYMTSEDFKKKVMDYQKHPDKWVFEGKRPVLIDFYATWCRPCRMTSPIVEQLAKEYNGKVDVYKIDVDKEQEVASVFGIESIPTFLFVPVKGQPTVQVGALDKATFEEIIKTIL